MDAKKETALLSIKTEYKADVVAEVDRLRNERDEILARARLDIQADVTAEMLFYVPNLDTTYHRNSKLM